VQVHINIYDLNDTLQHKSSTLEYEFYYAIISIQILYIASKKNYDCDKSDFLSIHKPNRMMSYYKTLINITGNAYVYIVCAKGEQSAPKSSSIFNI